jgi:hypothetical protein
MSVKPNLEVKLNINNEEKIIGIYNSGVIATDIIMSNKNYYFSFTKELWLYISDGNFKIITAYEVQNHDVYALIYQSGNNIMISKKNDTSVLDTTNHRLINCFSAENGKFYLTYSNDEERVY